MLQTRDFPLSDTHGIVLRPDVHLHATSERLGWQSVFVSAQFETPFEACVDPIPDHLLVLHVGGPARVKCVSGLDCADRIVPPGGLVIHPGGRGFNIRLDAPIETIHINIRRHIINQAAAELEGKVSQIELVRRTGISDGLLEHLGLALRNALQSDFSPLLYVEHLVNAMASHLAQFHSTAFRRPTPPKPAGALDQKRLNRALEYISEFIDRRLSAEEISDAVGISSLHFQRCFKKTTGLPLHRYVLRERVLQAKRLLAADRMSIAEVALACGFSHQEHLTRVFRKCCGTTPAAFRRSQRS